VNDGRLLRYRLQAARAIVNNEPFVDDLADGLRRTVGADCMCIDVCRNWPQQALR
jgi:hypothetical protein